jgi:hypothetical protein
MDAAISHDLSEETIEAKTLWFRSLPLEERMEMLCTFTELLLETNPSIIEHKNVEPIEGHIRVLTKA